MNFKKRDIIIVSIAIVLIFVIIKVMINKKDANTNEQTTEYTNISYELENSTNEYIIYDKETGAEITRVDEEGALKTFEENPDFDPKLNSIDLDS